MAGALSGLNAFAGQAGPIPLSQLDSNFSALVTAINTIATYDNLYNDSSGAPNSIVVTVSGPTLFAYSFGVMLQVQVANTTTSSVVQINVNGLGAKTIVNSDGSALSVGQFLTGTIVTLQYDGTNFRVIGSNSNSFSGPILGRGIALCAYKPGTTSRTTAGSSTIDPDLQVTLQPGSYAYKLWVDSISANAGGIGYYMQYGGTISGGNWHASAYLNGAAVTVPATAYGSTRTSAQVGNTDWISIEGVLSCTGAPSALALWWNVNTTVGTTSLSNGALMVWSLNR